jgi:broad-specificity NMP kinase
MKRINDNGAANLYAAIFKQAVEDDVRFINLKLKDELEVIGYSKEKIKEKIGEHQDFIKENVRESVLIESQHYPNYNKRENTRSNTRIIKAIMKDIE